MLYYHFISINRFSIQNKILWIKNLYRTKRQLIYQYEKAVRYADLNNITPVLFNNYMLHDELNHFGTNFISEAINYLHNNKSKMITNISKTKEIKENLAIVAFEELQKTDFSKLKDDNFILNKDLNKVFR